MIFVHRQTVILIRRAFISLGHLRSFTFSVAPDLQEAFCLLGGLSTYKFISVLVTREKDKLPSDVNGLLNGKEPKPTADVLAKMADFFGPCFPFTATVLGDAEVNKHMPRPLHKITSGKGPSQCLYVFTLSTLARCLHPKTTHPAMTLWHVHCPPLPQGTVHAY